MAVLMADDRAVDSTIVTDRTGWSEWKAGLRIPDYESQELSLSFYLKGRKNKQYLGSYRFEYLSDGVYSISVVGGSDPSAYIRFRVSFNIE